MPLRIRRPITSINGIDRARFEIGVVLEVLDRLRAEGQRFGMVICDPPKYARQAKDVEVALKGYLRLNLAALEVLATDGILVTCSCSGLVCHELFADVLGQVAEQSGRPIQILEPARAVARSSGLGELPGNGVPGVHDRGE